MLNALYVDDEADLRDLAMFSLELDPDIDLRTASSAAQALEILAEFRADVALLDVMMPQMDGPGLLAAMRAIPSLAAIPVIFVTARALSEECERLLALGAVAVITKPFDPMTFAADIRKILGATDAG